MSNIKNLQKNWEGFAKIDPLWAICTHPGKIKNKWSKEDFFLTGKIEVETVWKHIKSLGTPVDTKRALDFGCGVGRLTQAFAKHFTSCYGVDISPTMIELANKYNRYPKKCQYLVNDSPDLSLFKDNYFSFIYSSIVFQHMQPRYAKQYLKEFVRILKPGGLMVFQIPDRYKGKHFELKGLSLRTLIGKLLVPLGIGYKMEMHCIPENVVKQFLSSELVIDVKLVNSDISENFCFLKSEPETGYVFKQYYVKKR